MLAYLIAKFKRPMHMILNRITAVTMPLMLLLYLFSNTTHADTYSSQKVVYHLNYQDDSRINATFSNMQNHIDALGEDNIDLKAVVHGPTIEYFMEATNDSEKQILLDTLRMQGVQFLICGNTLKGYHVTHLELYEVSPDDVVMAGLPTIVELQQQGYFYLRP